MRKILMGIILLMFLVLGGCAGYSGNYRYDPYSGYYHYPYGSHGYPYRHYGSGYHGGWNHW